MNVLYSQLNVLSREKKPGEAVKFKTSQLPPACSSEFIRYKTIQKKAHASAVITPNRRNKLYK